MQSLPRSSNTILFCFSSRRRHTRCLSDWSSDVYSSDLPHYGLDGPPNFEGTHWHLHVARTLGAVAEQLGKSEEACARLLDSGRKKLFAARETREIGRASCRERV